MITATRAELKAEKDNFLTVMSQERVKIQAANEKELAQLREQLQAEVHGEIAKIVVTAVTKILKESPDTAGRWQASAERVLKDLQ